MCSVAVGIKRKTTAEMASVHRALVVAPVRMIVRHLRLTSAHQKVVQVQSKAEFTAEVLSSDKPVVVDFHAK